MNNFKKSFLVSTSLLWGMHDVGAMEEENISITRLRVLNSTISYKKGQFNCHEEGNALFIEPNRSSSPPTQSVQICNRQPLPMPAEESILMRLQPGNDGRIRIKQTTEWPHLLNGQMSMKYLGGEYGGSGTLIGPHHILTAAHNIYNVAKKEWAQSIAIHVGRNKSVSPFGEIRAVHVYTFSQYVEDGNENYDMALLVLNHSIGYKTGWCGLLCTDDDNLLKEKVTITGYPGDKGFTKMMTMSHTVKSVELEKLYYDIDTYGGQSGSGIVINKWGSPYLVGVHTHGEGALYQGNSGVRLSPCKIKTISEWVSKSLVLQQRQNPAVNFSPPLPNSTAIPAVARRNALVLQQRQNPAVNFSSQHPIRSAIPDVARGYEEIYEMFLKGVLVYRPQEGSDVGKVEMPIAALDNPLGGTFDLSYCGDTGKYLSISTGYKKRKIAKNAEKLEIWFAPRFLIEKELETSATHFNSVFDSWNISAPVGIFWTWGGWDRLDYFDSLTTKSMEDLETQNLYESKCAALTAKALQSIVNKPRRMIWQSKGECSKRADFFHVHFG